MPEELDQVLTELRRRNERSTGYPGRIRLTLDDGRYFFQINGFDDGEGLDAIGGGGGGLEQLVVGVGSDIGFYKLANFDQFAEFIRQHSA